MSSHDKMKAIENWQIGEVEVMVSTSAFGLGVDRKDVDVVVKIGVPQSLEELVQMFGRADIEEISKGKMLSDTHINSASALIKQDFPEIKGTLNLQRNAGGFQPMGEGSIQIFYCGTIKHWVTSSYIDGKVLLYDSLQMETLPDALQQQIIAV